MNPEESLGILNEGRVTSVMETITKEISLTILKFCGQILITALKP